MQDKLHYIDLVDGKFSSTSYEDLKKTFSSIQGSPAGKNLVVHFHGGLVNHSAAMRVMDTLLQPYTDGEAYPVFFVWNSDLWTTVRRNWDEIANEKIFKLLIWRVARFALGKLKDSALGRGDGRVELTSVKDIPDDPEGLEEFLVANTPEVHEIPPLTPVQEDQFKEDLESDDDIKNEALRIAAGLRTQDEIDAEIASRGIAPVRGSVSTLISPSILREINEEATTDEGRGLFTIGTVIKYGVEVLAAVVKRYAQGRQHGLYTTIVEEVLRTLYLDNVGVLAWEMMKKDTGDAFENDVTQYGGTAFVAELKRLWSPGQRVTLVGHSTGAIYIGELLEHADRVLPKEAKFDVIFLAPACTFSFINERLPLFERRVDNIRVFALQDDIERDYWEVPFFYKGSLLYMVSGLFEADEVDMPLVGMQRYYQGEPGGPYDRESVNRVKNYLMDHCIWSVADHGPGKKSSSKKHGDFDNDTPTKESLTQVLKNGF